MIVATREDGIPAGEAGYTVPWTIAKAKELGFGGVELGTDPRPNTRRRPARDGQLLPSRRRRLSPPGVWPEALNADERAQLRELADQSGVAITSLSSEWIWGYSKYHPTLDDWDRGRDLLKKDMELTADLGAKVCLVPSFAETTGTWEQAKRVLSETAETAARRGVVAGVEGSIWWRAGLGDEEELLEMIEQIGSPGLGVYGHPQGTGTANADEIRMVGKHLVCLHHFAMSPDQVDYPAMFQALRDVGYDYAWVFEVPEEDVPESKRVLDELMAKYWVGEGSLPGN
ncbi:MAG: sugar phosphate isomerase/epimerase [Acidimicrobiaceae bacterium]|nr:sugar phosphate isomerase/epimerase [Acidimicrobiaceae bacterium]